MQTEVATLIATRVPPGDNWKMVGESGEILHSLTEVLEYYVTSTGDRCPFRLNPFSGEIFSLHIEQVQQPTKKYNLYDE